MAPAAKKPRSVATGGVAATGARATPADFGAVAEVASLAVASARAIAGDDAWGNIAAQLHRIRALDKGPRRDITILGAGMAGLAAAYELEKLGHRVRVLEGNERLGGRVYTHRFADGAYHELGAMRIPKSHDYTRHYIEALGLQLRKFVTKGEEPDAFFDVDGVKTRIADAPQTLYPRYRLSEADKAAPSPAAMLGRHLTALVESLTVEEKGSLFSTELSTERLRQLDRMSLSDYLRAQGEGEDAMRLISAATAMGPQMMGQSVTHALREELRANDQGLEEIVGGMDQLAHGLAARLKAPVELGTQVLGIRNRDDGKVELTVSRHGGKPQSEAHEVVLTTLPFPVMRHIDLPTFSAEKQQAIREMRYGSATKVLLDVRERFWEQQGVFGGASGTDQLSGQTYYPSDNASTASPEERARISRGPGALLGSYVWGEQALAAAAMPEAERVRAVVESVARIHPELKEPGMVKDAATLAWDTHPWTGGAFGEPGAGQHALYRAAIKREGNVHFAGEHTSLDQGWIQGALISALRAVEEIVTQPAEPKRS